MKKVKRRIKKIKRKYDRRLKHFWDYALNPITGLKKPTPLTEDDEGIPNAHKCIMRNSAYKSNGHQ